MISITIWDIAVFAAFYALLYAGPVLLGAAVLLLAIPAARRLAATRRTAYGMLAVLMLLALGASPFLASLLGDARRARAFQARTHHLAAPQTFDDTMFPAGSTVHVSETGTPEFGSLPVPTPVLGLPLVGDFALDVDYSADRGSHPVGVTSGTLAGPADIGGIPCGPGPLAWRDGSTRCTLAHDHVFAGHVLAAGQPLEVFRSSADQPYVLQFGALARPELLYDVLWPAGTILGPVSEPSGRMAHGPGPDSLLVRFCVPSGATADIGGAVLHGFAAFGVLGHRRSVAPICTVMPNSPVSHDGYAQVGALRFTWGERPDATSPWTWNTPFEPQE